MMLLIGLFLIIPVALILLKLSDIKIKLRDKILLNLSMIGMSIIYILLCIIVNKEPFNFTVNNPAEYNIYVAVIFVFSPFLWIVTIYYISRLVNKVRVRKNSKIKSDKYFKYYRDQLDKVSPNVIMFTSQYGVDIKKSITSTILKLKLAGYLETKKTKLKCTDKDQTPLLESEKMILNLISSNKLDRNLYIKTIEEETIKNKYVTKHHLGVIGRIIKIITIITIAVISFYGSIKLDSYVFYNYRKYTNVMTGQKYYKISNEKDIETLCDEVTDKSDFFRRQAIHRNEGYPVSYIKADKTQYSVVKKAIFLNIIVPVSILLCVILGVIAIYMVIDQLININKNYRRTIKGKDLLNKAYALKNFLEDFSTNDKKEKELILWEYYLVYAAVLGVNVKVQDEVIQKYMKDIQLYM